MIEQYVTTHMLGYSGPLDDFDVRTDHLYEALLDLTDIQDPDMAVDLQAGSVEVVMVLDSDSFEDAVVRSIVALRTAIHTIGGATPGWENYIQEISHGARLLDARQPREGDDRLTGV